MHHVSQVWHMLPSRSFPPCLPRLTTDPGLLTQGTKASGETLHHTAPTTLVLKGLKKHVTITGVRIVCNYSVFLCICYIHLQSCTSFTRMLSAFIFFVHLCSTWPSDMLNPYRLGPQDQKHPICDAYLCMRAHTLCGISVVAQVLAAVIGIGMLWQRVSKASRCDHDRQSDRWRKHPLTKVRRIPQQCRDGWQNLGSKEWNFGVQETQEMALKESPWMKMHTFGFKML